MLTLDQVAAAAPFATPETDAQLARLAVGKAPTDIALVARTLVPPKVADDQALYQRRALSMTWTHGGRELVINGRLPLEQGVAFEQAIWNRQGSSAPPTSRDGDDARVAAVHRRCTRHARHPRRRAATMACDAAGRR